MIIRQLKNKISQFHNVVRTQREHGGKWKFDDKIDALNGGKISIFDQKIQTELLSSGSPCLYQPFFLSPVKRDEFTLDFILFKSKHVYLPEARIKVHIGVFHYKPLLLDNHTIFTVPNNQKYFVPEKDQFLTASKFLDLRNLGKEILQEGHMIKLLDYLCKMQNLMQGNIKSLIDLRMVEILIDLPKYSLISSYGHYLQFRLGISDITKRFENGNRFMPGIFNSGLPNKYLIDFDQYLVEIHRHLQKCFQITFDLTAIPQEYSFLHDRIHPELRLASQQYSFGYHDFALMIKKDLNSDLALEYSFEGDYYSAVHARLIQKVIADNGNLISILRKMEDFRKVA